MSPPVSPIASAPKIPPRADVVMVDSIPDALPVIAPINARRGHHIVSGFSGHGFGNGPTAGRLAADLIRGGAPCVDPTPYRHERMIDGTDLGKPGTL